MQYCCVYTILGNKYTPEDEIIAQAERVQENTKIFQLKIFGNKIPKTIKFRERCLLLK